MKYLIYSQQETDSFGKKSFWSNEFGWTGRDEATVYDSDDVPPESMFMPIPDGVVVSVEQADSCGYMVVYGRRTAIADGVLLDLSTEYPEEAKLFACPVACTESVWNLVAGAGADRESLKGVVWDLLWMASLAAKKSPEAAVVVFDVILPVPVRVSRTLKMMVGPDDNLARCITIMLPHED
ncbi:hypothetical protein FY034_17770 (plasmid) [Trichlorobacter lovleyi]|uniref:DUF6573 family protein n=1 Tax=Trichlorobacter lovleyi TaxID=313985 RepID=UPI002240CAA5|nr:DUF6573 family protein [Trichlorobacter lovleyi]QOX80871.1 hypothetical protein FY034_17770 [Trichlorobacter lovleyi]